MFAVLHFPQFALQAALRHEPELWSRPVALVDPADKLPDASGSGIIFVSNKAERGAGVLRSAL